MTTCSQVEDYVAGRLASADAQAFETHAASCAACGKAVARRRAVELAAKVHQRNQQSRGDTAPPVATASDRGPLPSFMPATTVEHSAGAPTAELDARPVNDSGRTRLVAVGVALALAVGLVLLVRSGGKAPPAKKEEPASVSRAEPPASPPPTAPEPAPETATAIVPPPPPVKAPSPAPEPSTKPAPPAALPAAPAAASPAASVTASSSDSLPLDADIETIAEVVASKRCGPAVAPLRARVSQDGTDARSWALLAQCYSKRKRWQNVLDAYDMVVRYGAPELVESLRSTADAARAELAASDGVAVTPASP